MRSLRLACLLLVLAGCRSGSDPADPAPRAELRPGRSFHVRYESYVKGAPAGRKLQLWIPVPTSDEHQRITNLTVRGVPGELRSRYTADRTYGNRLLYLEGAAPERDFTVSIEFDVARFENRADLASLSAEGRPEEEGREFAKYLQPSRLVVVNDRVRELAARLARGKRTRLAKARAFYDHIVREMTYGKPEDKPWGRGDTLYACDARIGNCTDFHSYFLSLCRAEGIPARFQIGLFGEYERRLGKEYKTGGYHCWAEFHVAGKGWIPVDISEGSKRGAAGAAIYFGYHTDNRVTISIGRDIVLEPRQSGEPLNFVIHPYAEVDGKPFEVAKQGYWTDQAG